MKSFYPTYLRLAFVLCWLASCHPEKEQIQPQSLTHSIPEITTDRGMLVFSDESVFVRTIEDLNAMSNEDYATWCEKKQVETFRLVFDKVKAAEWKISDEYEEQMSQGQVPPFDAIHSAEYQKALDGGIIYLHEGEYFDYNIFEKQVASAINQNGLVKIGEHIVQFGSEYRKIILGGDPSKVKYLINTLRSDSVNSIAVFPYSDSEKGTEGMKVNARYGHRAWLWANRAGNDWVYSPNSVHRYRMYLIGASFVDDGISAGSQHLFVTNQLRIEGQKKNVFGNWGYRDLYPSSGTVTWSWFFQIGSTVSTNLPFTNDFPVPNTSPHSWQVPNPGFLSGMNNATYTLRPHTNGQYVFSSFGGILSGVDVHGVTGTGHLDNVWMTLGQRVY